MCSYGFIVVFVFVHESDLSKELNLAAILDLIWMRLTSLLWSCAMVWLLHQLYLVMFYVVSALFKIDKVHCFLI